MKDIEYYMSLPYVIELTPIRLDEGGGFVARIPQLGRYAFVGDGETINKALWDLERTKRDLFEEYLEKGIPIPEPEPASSIYEDYAKIKEQIENDNESKGGT